MLLHSVQHSCTHTCSHAHTCTHTHILTHTHKHTLTFMHTQLRISEMEVSKARNLIEHEREIFSRPARTWIPTNTSARRKRETSEGAEWRDRTKWGDGERGRWGEGERGRGVEGERGRGGEGEESRV